MRSRSDARTRFPLNEDLTAEFDRLLRRHVSEVRDYTSRFHNSCQRQGLSTMRGTGWSVRPFFVPTDFLEFIGSAIHTLSTEVRNQLRTLAGDPRALARALPMLPDIGDRIDVNDAVWSAAFLSWLRPDGFLFGDRYVLSEFNYGNGILVSAAYTELLHRYWKSHPILNRLGWDVDRLHRRPFMRMISVARHFARAVARPRIALVAPDEEWAVIKSYPARFQQLFAFATQAFRDAGMSLVRVSPDDLSLTKKGEVVFDRSGKPVDLVMFATVSSSILDRPDVTQPGTIGHSLTQAKIGSTWVLKPLGGLLFDKGTLALPLPKGVSTQHTHDFRFEVAPTRLAHQQSERSLLAGREKLIIKRAFEGKDTTIGCVSSAETWAAAVKRSRTPGTHVVQPYVSLPKCRIPLFVDEKHLEWVESRVELSAFLFDGAFGGAAVRHAPDKEGLIMTDPPDDYGYSTVFCG